MHITSGLGKRNKQRMLRVCIRHEHFAVLEREWDAACPKIDYALQAISDMDLQLGEQRIIFFQANNGEQMHRDEFQGGQFKYRGVYFKIGRKMPWLPSVNQKTLCRVVSFADGHLELAYKTITATEKPVAKEPDVAVNNITVNNIVVGDIASDLTTIGVLLNEAIATAASRGFKVSVVQGAVGENVAISLPLV